jgi:hypothetical protein
MTDRDDFVPGTDPRGEQRQVQGGGAIRNGAGVRCANNLAEVTLKRGDLGTLGNPTRENDTTDRIRFALIKKWFGNWDHGRKTKAVGWWLWAIRFGN